jgi:thiopeptide-type bacteriocin biosynthesis protein
MYIKLYGPRNGQNELLAGPVRSLCDEIHELHIADDWFFVRYADPHPHLRLRFRGSPQRLTEALFPRLCSWATGLVKNGRCLEFAFDTYQREVERYGGATAMIIAEELFAADSRAAVELLGHMPTVDRTALCVVSVGDLLDSLYADKSSRLTWLKEAVNSRKDAGVEYRATRDTLIAVVRDPSQLDASIPEALASRRAAVKCIAARLGRLDADAALSQPLSRVYGSYVHMHFNRLGLGGDPSTEQRTLGLLLRTLDTISNRAAMYSDDQP